MMRGCGTRIANGMYATCGLSPAGRPIEYFLFDPPILDIPLGVTPRGVQLVEHDGIWHVIDWVGSESYPNVADFVEETRELGLSRRLPSTLDFSKLTADSRILLIHAKAHIVNWPDYRYGRHPQYDCGCPKAVEGHGLAFGAMCAGLWWVDVVDSEPNLSFHLRHMPADFAYTCLPTPDNVDPVYQPGYFMWLPIRSIEIVRGEKAAERAALARKSSLPVVIKEE